MFKSTKRIFTSIILSFVLLASAFFNPSLLFASENEDAIKIVNGITLESGEYLLNLDTGEVIESTEYSTDTKIVNLVRLKIDVSSSKIVFKLNHLGTDRLDKINLRLKVTDAYGKEVYNKLVTKSSLSNGEHILGTYSKGISSVQEDATITGTVLEGGKSNVVSFGAWRGNFAGGKYSSLSALGGHRHHIPASAALSGVISSSSAPAIRMTISDHKKTASYGSSTAAKNYRAKQAALIKGRNFGAAQDMDISDIRAKFGSKYNSAINQAVSYARSVGLR